MGAENSVLEGCQWGQEVSASGLDWDLQHAELNDGRPITVFQPRKNERKYNDMILQLAKSLKQLRHPSILRYVGAGRTSEGHYLVTEQATPLSVILDSLSPFEVCSGLSDIFDALTFLHDKVGMAHNNVGVWGVFVTKDGSWKLGELQHSCSFTAATPQFLDTTRAFRCQEALAPEEKQNKMDTRVELGHARDMYGAGVLCEQMSEQLSELGEFGKSFEQRIGKCLSPDPSVRPRALELRNDCIFQNDFIEILSFIRNVALKSAEEKADFFRDLLPRLLALPEELVARRLAIPLLSRFVLLEEAAVNHVVPHLLTPRPDPPEEEEEEENKDVDRRPSVVGTSVTPLLSSELFVIYVIPELQRIFLVHDVHIRLVLLAHFSAYAPLFEPDALHADIFPQVLLGLRDSHDSIVSSSLRALADLVPLLGGDVVIGGHRKTFFFEGMPKHLPGREKDKGPGSAGEVLWPDDKKARTLNGKPLLKDLAMGSVSRPSKTMEQQRRQEERERRRDEARRKKEERQRKFKLLQAEIDADQSHATTTESIKTSTTDNSVAPDDHFSNADKSRKDRATAHHDSTDMAQPREESEDMDKDIDKEDTLTDDDDEVEEKFASEESAEEWEDWDDIEDKGHHSSGGGGEKPKPHYIDDDIISDEIEAELSRMSVGKMTTTTTKGGGGGVKKKVPTSPDPYTPSSPSDAVWTESQFDVDPTTQSSLSSSSSSSSKHWTEVGVEGGRKSSQGVVIVGREGKTDANNSRSEQDSATLGGKGLKLVGKTKSKTGAAAASSSSSSATKASQQRKTGPSEDLGLGYDIKSIQLAVVKQEEDFFADMTPNIRPAAAAAAAAGVKGPGVLDLEATTSSGKEQQRAGPSLFAMVESTVEDSAAGWDDEDGDWGGDF